MQPDFTTVSLPSAGRVIGARPERGFTWLAGGALAESGRSRYMQRGFASGGGSARQHKSELGGKLGVPV